MFSCPFVMFDASRDGTLRLVWVPRWEAAIPASRSRETIQADDISRCAIQNSLPPDRPATVGGSEVTMTKRYSTLSEVQHVKCV
jgi:hypothetical protein